MAKNVSGLDSGISSPFFVAKPFRIVFSEFMKHFIGRLLLPAAKKKVYSPFMGRCGERVYLIVTVPSICQCITQFPAGPPIVGRGNCAPAIWPQKRTFAAGVHALSAAGEKRNAEGLL